MVYFDSLAPSIRFHWCRRGIELLPEGIYISKTIPAREMKARTEWMAENIRPILAWSVPALVSLYRSQSVSVNRQHKWDSLRDLRR